MKKVSMVFLGAIAGFTIGYLIFGIILGRYVDIASVFDFSGGDLGSFGRSVGGIKGVQQKVFLFTGIGAVAGLVYSIIKKK